MITIAITTAILLLAFAIGTTILLLFTNYVGSGDPLPPEDGDETNHENNT